VIPQSCVDFRAGHATQLIRQRGVRVSVNLPGGQGGAVETEFRAAAGRGSRATVRFDGVVEDSGDLTRYI
jgi:hypothetical protein